MLEKEFKGTCDRLLALANTEGQDVFAAEIKKINRQLRNQYIDFHGALCAGMFVLRDVRTGEKILPEIQGRKYPELAGRRFKHASRPALK
jgi:hypothetical protein